MEDKGHMKKDAKRTTIWLHQDVRTLADRLCEHHDRSLSKVIQIALVNMAGSDLDAGGKGPITNSGE